MKNKRVHNHPLKSFLARIILLWLAMLCLPFAGIQAQNIPAVTLGPKIGINSSVLYTDINYYKESETLGYKGGLFFRFGNRNRVYLQPEAYFDLKGGTFSYDIGETDPFTPSLKSVKDAKLTVKLQTVDVPLLVGLKVLDLFGFNFRVMAGPVASYVIEEDVSLFAGGEDQSFRLPDKLFADAIWSMQAGGGMDIMMFTVDFRYEFGINNISNVNTAVTRTYLYNLSVGLKLL